MASNKRRTKTKETRNHELRTIANGVDSAVLDDDTLVGREKALQRADDLPQVRLVTLVVIQPLRIHNVVQSDHAAVLIHGSTAHTSEFLHVRTNAKQKTKVDTQSPNVGSRFAADPENTKVSVIVEFEKLALVNGPDTKLALDGGDQRRPLEKCTSQGFQSASELGLAAGNLVMETDNANVFLSCTLLRLNQTSRTVDTDDQASCDLGVQSSTVASLLGSIKAQSSVYCLKGALRVAYLKPKKKKEFYLKILFIHATTS